MKKILLIGGFLGGFLNGHTQTPVKDIEYDTIKIIAQVYILSFPGNPLCPSYLIKAWEVRAWYTDKPEEEVIYDYQQRYPTPHHHDYLEMNKRNKLGVYIYDSKELNWK